MKAARHIAISILGAILCFVGLPFADHVAARADEAACEAKPVAAARKAAQARRVAADPLGAWKILEPFTALGCLDEAAKQPNAADRKRLADVAWLLNDAYVNGADPRLGPEAPAGNDACVELLRPLADDDLVPRPWMSVALRQATIANIKACAAHCIPAACAPFGATVWATYRSEERQFGKRACSGGGQKLDDGRCLQIRPGKAGFDFSWSGNIKGDPVKGETASPAELRSFCPALYVRGPGGNEAVRLELPETSALRDDSTCCANFHLKVKPGTDEFVIAGDGMLRECYGGTAERMIEEVYRLPPGAEKPVLLRNNDEGVH